MEDFIITDDKLEGVIENDNVEVEILGDEIYTEQDEDVVDVEIEEDIAYSSLFELIKGEDGEFTGIVSVDNLPTDYAKENKQDDTINKLNTIETLQTNANSKLDGIANNTNKLLKIQFIGDVTITPSEDSTNKYYIKTGVTNSEYTTQTITINKTTKVTTKEWS